MEFCTISTLLPESPLLKNPRGLILRWGKIGCKSGKFGGKLVPLKNLEFYEIAKNLFGNNFE